MMIIAAGNLLANITNGVFVYEEASRTMTPTETLDGSTPASILAVYIVDTLGLMSWPLNILTWPLYISSMPDGDNVETDCGAIYDTSGFKDGRLMIGLVPLHQGIQIKIRSRVYETGYAKIEAVASALDAIAKVSVGVSSGDIYEIQNASRTTDVASLGMEPGTKRRYLFTVNYLLTLKKLI